MFRGLDLLGTMAVWKRVDGTTVSIHPNWSRSKFSCYTGDATQDHELPKSGKGGTSGPGTFKYFKNKHHETTLKFDPAKTPQPQSREAGMRPEPWQQDGAANAGQSERHVTLSAQHDAARSSWEQHGAPQALAARWYKGEWSSSQHDSCMAGRRLMG